MAVSRTAAPPRAGAGSVPNKGSATWAPFGSSAMSGVFPEALSSWSLAALGNKQQGRDGIVTNEQRSAPHEWTQLFASPCSVAREHDRSSAVDTAWKPEHMYGNLEGGQRRGLGDKAFLAESEVDFTSSTFDEDVEDPAYRIVRFDHCKPASVGVGVYFEKLPASEIIRVVRLQVCLRARMPACAQRNVIVQNGAHVTDHSFGSLGGRQTWTDA